MNTTICTLFEGDYHYGVAAFVNSLYLQGYRGLVVAGYRGALPNWATHAISEKGHHDMVVRSDLIVRFVPVSRKGHLTNLKPHFMMDIWATHTPDAEALFYFDPDIVVKCRWSFFEEWCQAGIALCADVNCMMPADHPLRHAWKRFFETRGSFEIVRKLDLYFNAGFIGIHRSTASFLHLWRQLTELMAPEIGGLENTNIGDRTYLFCKTDQDVLNFAAMATPEAISPLGQDGMDFQAGGGGYVMSHAIGSPKPWQKRMIASSVFRGRPPSRGDRAFIDALDGPIRPYGAWSQWVRKADIRVASAFSRYFG